ncbi:MAG TPA: hypothetical protein VID74_06275 [Gemmatimonadales bacterium]|jgi:hypothetical protein
MLLTRTELAALRTSLRDQLVLSVYLSPAVDNPAEHGSRGVTLTHEFAAIRERLAAAGREERDAFEAAAGHLEAASERHADDPGDLGWVAFATADGVRFQGTVPAPSGTLIRWQRGIWATPYVRALKQNRAVIVAVVDGISADIYRYQANELVRVARIDVHPHGGHADHLGAPSREGFHPGTRGVTGSDLASRSRIIARDRVVTYAAERISELGGEHEYVVIGGTPTASAALREALLSRSKHLLVLPEIKRRTSVASLRQLAAAGASQLRAADDSALIGELVERTGAHGTAVAGAVATLDALAGGQVRELLLAEKFIVVNPADAERAIGLALDSNADLEIVTGAPAEELGRVAGGIAAKLRYVAHPAAPLATVAG